MLPIVLPDPQPGKFEYGTPKPQDPHDPVTVADVGLAEQFKSRVLQQYKIAPNVNATSLGHASLYLKRLSEAVDPPTQGLGITQLHELLQQIQNTLQDNGNRLGVLEDLAGSTDGDIQTIKADINAFKVEITMLKDNIGRMGREMEASMTGLHKKLVATNAMITKLINLQIDGVGGPLQEVPLSSGEGPWGKLYSVEVMADGQPVKKRGRDVSVRTVDVDMLPLTKAADIDALSVHQKVAYHRGYYHEQDVPDDEEILKSAIAWAIGCKAIPV